MLSITGLSLTPVKRLNSRKRGVNRRSYLADCPPPIDITHDWDFGAYCFKANVDAYNMDGGHDRSFIGYSQNMNISERTKYACERHKKAGTVCSEPQVSMKGGECDEVIFMKLKNSTKLINLSNPFQ